MVAASGTLAAIAQAFMGKQTRAMAAFQKGLGGGASGRDSGEMDRMRRRIKGLTGVGVRG